MGSENSKISEKGKKRHKNQRLKNASQVVIKGRQYISATFTVASNDIYKSWKAQLQKQPVAHVKFAFIPIKEKVEEGMCGNSQAVKVIYPDYWYVLSDQIQSRRSSNKPIQEFEIWSVLKDTAKATSHYHQSHTKVGDIRPENILLNNEGRVSLITQHSFPEESTNYVKTLRTGEKTYLAPEQVNDVNVGYPNQTTSFQQAQSFSLGLSCLDAALMENSYSLYGKKGEDFSFQGLQDKRFRIKSHPSLSSGLKGILLNLTEPNPKNRISSINLSDWLKHYEPEIENQFPFECERLPQSVKKTMEANSLSTNEKGELIKRATSLLVDPFNSGTSQNTPSFPALASSFSPSKLQNFHSYASTENLQNHPRQSILHTGRPVFPIEKTLQIRQPNVSNQRRQNLPKVFSPRSPNFPSDYPSNYANYFPRPTIYTQLQNANSNEGLKRVKSLEHQFSNPKIEANYILNKKQMITENIQKAQSKGRVFAEQNEEKDYNQTQVKASIVNRGSTSQMVNMEVEENYPAMNKISKTISNKNSTPSANKVETNYCAPDNENLLGLASSNLKSENRSNGIKSRFREKSSKMEEIVEEDSPQRQKPSFGHNSQNSQHLQHNSQNQQQVTKSFATLSDLGSEKPYKISFANNRRMPIPSSSQQNVSHLQPAPVMAPRLQSVISSDSEMDYKISFANNKRLSIKDAFKSMNSEVYKKQVEEAQKSRAAFPPPYYHNSPSNSEYLLKQQSILPLPRSSIIQKKKHSVHEEDPEQFNSRVQKQKTYVIRYPNEYD